MTPGVLILLFEMFPDINLLRTKPEYCNVSLIYCSLMVVNLREKWYKLYVSVNLAFLSK